MRREGRIAVCFRRSASRISLNGLCSAMASARPCPRLDEANPKLVLWIPSKYQP